MRNKWYTAKIMKRFMTPKECAEFDEKYRQHKIVSMGQYVEKKKGLMEKLFRYRNAT